MRSSTTSRTDRGALAESVVAKKLRHMVLLTAAGALLSFTMPGGAEARWMSCPRGMVSVAGSFCIDAYEGSIEYRSGRRWALHSPYESVQGKQIRAVSRAGAFPQAYISRNEAAAACRASGKALCTEEQWVRACKGTRGTTYPYGNDHRAGSCNDAGKSPLNHFYGTREGPPASAYGWEPMNDPRLNQLPGTLARTGSHRRCAGPLRIYDMVGNLHEWVDDPAGTFRGGYYLDTRINGLGCEYRTSAHNAEYHDYSTGFRCCAKAR